MKLNVELALVVIIGGNLLFMLWLWYRAVPGSGARPVLPAQIVLSISMLVGILPRVLWPTAERLTISGSIASVILTIVAVVVGVRRQRRLRANVRPG
jgi:hypothetical protein